MIADTNITGDCVFLFIRLVQHCVFNCGIGTKLNRYFGGWHAASTSRVEKIELQMLYCLQSWRHISETMPIVNVLESCGFR
jgi:hypothetical protein